MNRVSTDCQSPRFEPPFWRTIYKIKITVAGACLFAFQSFWSVNKITQNELQMPAFVPLFQISQAGLETITALWLSAYIILSYLLISVSCIQEQWCVCHYAMRYYTTWWMYISLCYRSRAWQLCGQAVDRLDEAGLSVLVLVPGQSSRELVQGTCRCLEIWSHPETRHTRPVSHRCPCTPRRLLPRYITSDTMKPV